MALERVAVLEEELELSNQEVAVWLRRGEDLRDYQWGGADWVGSRICGARSGAEAQWSWTRERLGRALRRDPFGRPEGRAAQ